MSISDNVFKTIEEKNIQPTARWKFVIKNTVAWLLGIIAVVIGTIGVSALLHIIRDDDWSVYQYTGKSFFEYVITIFPYFWLIVFFLFVFLAYLIISRTKTGYRYTAVVFFGVTLLISILLGSVLFVFGAGEYVDDALLQNVGVYAALPHNKTEIWNRPTIGLLSGTITRIFDNDEFILTDFTNQEWIIIDDAATWQNESLRNIGEKIKLLGAYENDGVFIAAEARPW